MFRLKPEPVPEGKTEEMERLWFAFEKMFLWPQQRAEDRLHQEDCTMFSCRHKPVKGVRSKVDEIYQWEDFANANFGTPLEDIQWT